jgi:hypothetical protein
MVGDIRSSLLFLSGAVGFGTVISAFVLAYLLKPGAKVLFSGRSFSQWSEWEVEEVEKLYRSPIRFVFMAVAGLLVVGVLGVVAAIALPSFLRARLSANEASAIADVRGLVSAEVAYAATNGGQYDTLDCLMKPEECRAGYRPDGRPFLSEPFVREKLGYDREFYPGPPSNPKVILFANLSRSSIQHFAVVAYTVRSGLTGVRSFCADYTGRVCVFADGSRPQIVNDQCAPHCSPLP